MSLYPPSDDHFQRIYSGDQTHLYDAMVLCEDVENNLLKTIAAYATLDGAQVVDVGAGTGRVSRLLASAAAEILSIDLNLPMLRIAQRHQRQSETRWHVVNADAAHLPVRSDWADLSIAGWAIGHFNGWFSDPLKLVDRALAEMARVLRAGGTQIIIETLGTGFDQPAPPNEALAAYYAHLETQHGFRRVTLRTDYLFPTVQEGAKLVKFFFSEDLSRRMIQENSPRLIEWTGVWWRMKVQDF